MSKLRVALLALAFGACKDKTPDAAPKKEPLPAPAPDPSPAARKPPPPELPKEPAKDPKEGSGSAAKPEDNTENPAIRKGEGPKEFSPQAAFDKNKKRIEASKAKKDAAPK